MAVVGAVALYASRPAISRGSIRVGSKNFTEQIVLGEIVAQQLEHAGLTVERRFNLGGTFICDRALRSGDLDVYVEYSGTAESPAILHTRPRVQGHDPLTGLRAPGERPDLTRTDCGWIC